jgi:cyclophilin family peptidyl-prolyl cis-trans isomerase/predicted phosphodiesterase
VKQGHYDNTVFHRVIPGFMVQGGGFEPGMTQKPTGAEIENEANNGLKNDNYTVAMARTSAPHSATAQFFINVSDNGFLNHTAPSAQGWGYAVFGKVIGGTDVVDKIKAVKTGRKGFHDDVPLEDVVIEKAVRHRRVTVSPPACHFVCFATPRGGRRGSPWGSPAAAAMTVFNELVAPPAWRTVDLMSDLHLQAGEPGTFEAWQGYLQTTPADALIILGDLFEVWVGDDAATQPGFEAQCAELLRRTAQRLPVFFMHGNRDFLVGPAFAAQCGFTLLDDPTVLVLHGRRWLLSHGDILCLEDTEYLKFRAQVRTPRGRPRSWPGRWKSAARSRAPCACKAKTASATRRWSGPMSTRTPRASGCSSPVRTRWCTATRTAPPTTTWATACAASC